MQRLRIHHIVVPLLLTGLMSLAAPAAIAKDTGIRSGISADLADAREEVRVELAAARRELDTGNLRLGQHVHFGKSGKYRSEPDPTLPTAEITPQGDLLIGGEPVVIDGRQRRDLLLYRRQVIDIAKAGIDIGERSAQVALDAVDRGVLSLLVGAMTGSLERRVEKTVLETVEPGVRQICRSLPALRDSQQRLSASLPAFRPYATLKMDDVEDCEKEIRQELAMR